MKTIAIICLIVLAPAVSFSEITERREISTSISRWAVDEYGPINGEYFINDRYTPDQIADSIGEPFYIKQDEESAAYFYKGYFVIVFYSLGYSRTVLVIDSTLYMVEDKWVFRSR